MAGINPGRAGLVSWWGLDESGVLLDSHGSNDLTRSGVTSTTTSGKVGSALVGGGGYVYRASNGSLETGDIDFSLVTWVYFTAINSYNIILAKGRGSSGSDTEYYIDYASQFRFYVGNASTLTGISSGVSASPNTWYMIAASHDAAANQLKISINGAAWTTQAYSGGVTVKSAKQFRLLDTDAAAAPMYGRQDQCAFYKVALSNDNLTWFFNSGAGRAYSEVKGGLLRSGVAMTPVMRI